MQSLIKSNRCKPINPCKLKNYQSGSLDADPMDRVRGLKHKKKRAAGGGLKRKTISPLTQFIGSASSGPDFVLPDKTKA